MMAFDTSLLDGDDDDVDDDDTLHIRCLCFIV